MSLTLRAICAALLETALRLVLVALLLVALTVRLALGASVRLAASYASPSLVATALIVPALLFAYVGALADEPSASRAAPTSITILEHPQETTSCVTKS